MFLIFLNLEAHFISHFTDDEIKAKKFPVYAVLFVKKLSRIWNQKHKQKRKSMMVTEEEDRAEVFHIGEDFENKIKELKGALNI